MAQQIAKWTYVQKSKTDYVEHPRLHLWTDSWLNMWILGTP